MPELDDYLAFVTSAHTDKPKFVATVASAAQPFVDAQIITLFMPERFDLDHAVGVQLDDVGRWIGASREVAIVVGTPPAAVENVNILSDQAYRVLLRARIVNNRWNGSIPLAYTIWDELFAGTGFSIRLRDHQDMTMEMDLLVPPGTLDPVVEALFHGGYLDVRPAGVRMFQREIVVG